MDIQWYVTVYVIDHKVTMASMTESVTMKKVYSVSSMYFKYKCDESIVYDCDHTHNLPLK